MAVKTNAAVAYGEIVWVRRPDAGVKFEGGQRGLRAMVSQKAGSPGRSRISRKAIAQGKAGCLRQTCMLMCSIFVATIAHETAGAARTRSSLRPLLFKRDNEMQTFGRIAPRECETVSIHRHSGAMQSIELRCAIAHLRISRFRVWSFGPSRNDSGYEREERMDCFASLAMTADGGKPLTCAPPRD